MEELKQLIRAEAVVYNQQVLRLDSILNHQVDPRLMLKIGKVFAQRYAAAGVSKVVTVESSGIPPAFAAAMELGVPLVFARRRKTVATDEDAFCERVPSFTKGIVTDMMISCKFLSPQDCVLIIDDIIANGDAARGLIRIVQRSGAKLAGMGIVIEKSFQAGGRTIREQGIRVESLVKIASLSDGNIVFDEP